MDKNGKAENNDSCGEAAPKPDTHGCGGAIVYFTCQTKEQAREKSRLLTELAASSGYFVYGVFYDKAGAAPHVFINLLDICCRMKRTVLIVESFECINFTEASAQAVVHYAAYCGLRIVAANRSGGAHEPIGKAALRYLKHIGNYFGFGPTFGKTSLCADGTVPMRGAIGRLPLGYCVKDSKIEVEKRSAEAVRTIFELFALGVSVNEIEKQIRERFSDVKCPTRNQIYFIVENIRYIGSNESGIALPPIIDNRLWLNVRAETSRRGLGGKEHCFLLNNLFFDDGVRMKPVLYCRSTHSPAYVRDDRAASICINAVELENAVLNCASKAFENEVDELVRLCKQTVSEKPRIEREFSTSLAERDRILSYSFDSRGGDSSPRSMVKGFDSRRAAIKLLEIAIEYQTFLLEHLNKTDGEIEEFFDRMKRMDSLCAEEIRYFLNILIKDITVSTDEIRVCCYLAKTRRIRTRHGIKIVKQDPVH